MIFMPGRTRDEAATDQFERLYGVGGLVPVQEGGRGGEEHVDTGSPGGGGVFVCRIVAFRLGNFQYTCCYNMLLVL